MRGSLQEAAKRSTAASDQSEGTVPPTRFSGDQGTTKESKSSPRLDGNVSQFS